MAKQIAYCGFDCATCEVRVATVNNDDVLREKIAEEWKKRYNSFDISTEMINCAGCKGEGVLNKRCEYCEIRKCALQDNLETCAECENFEDCKFLKKVHQNVPEALENLRSLFDDESDVVFDYDKTILTNRLEFRGKGSQKRFSIVSSFIMVVAGIAVGYIICSSQLSGNPSTEDYFMAFLFPVIIFMVLIGLVKSVLNKDKLIELEINIPVDQAKKKLIEAAKNLHWEIYVVKEKFIIFTTGRQFFSKSQTITLIVFPDKNIFFNSINYPYDYTGLSKFTDNYNLLMEEYLKLEKENNNKESLKSISSN